MNKYTQLLGKFRSLLCNCGVEHILLFALDEFTNDVTVVSI